MPQDKQCCDYCGTINETRVSKCQDLNCECHTPTSPKSDWRENLHRTIQEIMYPKKGTDGKFLMKIPPVIIDAIDAAYTAGLDDREEAFKAREALGQQNGMRMVVEEIHLESREAVIGSMDDGYNSAVMDIIHQKQQIKDKYNL